MHCCGFKIQICAFAYWEPQTEDTHISGLLSSSGNFRGQGMFTPSHLLAMNGLGCHPCAHSLISFISYGKYES